MSTHRSHPRRAAVALLAAAGTALAAAAPAAADSIAYVKDGAIFHVSPDGSRTERMIERPADAPFTALAHRTNGDVYAVKGGRLFDTTWYVRGEARGGAADVAEPALSPDSVTIAYTRAGTTSTAFADVESPTGHFPTYRPISGWSQPSWVPGEDDVLVTGPGGVAFANPDSGRVRAWAVPSVDGGLRDGEIARDLERTAFVAGRNDELIVFHRLPAGVYAAPVTCDYAITNPTGRFRSPSFSPDGQQLAYADDEGVWVVDLPASDGSTCGTPDAEPKLVAPGGASPDFGPWTLSNVTPPPPDDDDPGKGGQNPPGGNPPGGGGPPNQGRPPVAQTQPSRPAVTQAPPAPGGVRPGGAAPASPAASGTRLTVGTAKLRAALARGLVVRLTAAAPGAHRVSVTSGRTRVGAGRVTVGADGAGRATVRFTAAGRRALRRKRAARLTVSVAGARTVVTLRR